MRQRRLGAGGLRLAHTIAVPGTVPTHILSGCGPVTGKYIMIGAEPSDATPGRTVLSMAVSEDFYSWRVVKRILDYRTAVPSSIGFQYPD